jgi:tetratricopeptide (TPR) repeat protein
LDKITRRELKSDHFALEVGHGVDYLGHHRSQIIRWGSIALVAIILVVAISWFRNYRRAERQEALASALQIQNSAVGPPQSEFALAYPSQADKDKAMLKAFSDVATKYSDTDEGMIAEYSLGSIAADKGDMAQAEKRYKLVADSASNAYASLAKLSLAQVYQAQGKTTDAENLVKSVMDHPTMLVSKEQAIIALAHLKASSNPQEARKLLEPLRASQRGAISRAALSALGDLPQK